MLRLVSTLAAGALVSACLFPSFDDLRGAPPSDAFEAPARSAVEPTTTTTTESATPPPPAQASVDDAGVDAASTSTSTVPAVACGSARCGSGELCCTDFLGRSPTCQPVGSMAACATRVGCDDQSDCGPGLMCCAQGVESRCSERCDARVLCTVEDPRCPGTMTCSGTQPLGGITVRYCR